MAIFSKIDESNENTFADRNRESFKKLVNIPDAEEGVERTLQSQKFVEDNLSELIKIVESPTLLK